MYAYQNHTLPLKFHCKFTLQNQIHSYNTYNVRSVALICNN